MSAGTSAQFDDDPGEIESLTRARARVLERIADACGRVGRDPSEVTLVAVSKTVAPERIRAAISVGLTTLGENRVQEAATKIPEIGGATWHLIGPLQSNKARPAVELFDVIETVDSVRLAHRLATVAGELRAGRRLPVLLQVNVDRDPHKAGLVPEDLEPLLDEIAPLESLDVQGLMTIGRLVGTPGEARSTFWSLRELSARIREHRPLLGPGLSMGMSDDYEVAVEEGATIVRVGRALFGERSPVRP